MDGSYDPEYKKDLLLPLFDSTPIIVYYVLVLFLLTPSCIYLVPKPAHCNGPPHKATFCLQHDVKVLLADHKTHLLQDPEISE